MKMDKTLIKLNAIKKTYSEDYPVLVKMITEIIEEVEFKNTVLDDYLSEIEALKKDVKDLNEILDPYTPEIFKGTTEALNDLGIRGKI